MRKKILIACEESQRVCMAFRKRGFEAYSCDILPCSGDHPEWHIQDDVMKHLNDGWDLMIGHPECTYLCNSGVCWLYNKDGSKNIERWGKLKDGAEFFIKLWNANIPYIALENPIQHRYAKALIGVEKTQIIQPYMFGHAEQKATCLWLKNLPKLIPTRDVKAEMMLLPNKLRQKNRWMGGPDRHKMRSKTYQGIAEAMSQQWGDFLLFNR